MKFIKSAQWLGFTLEEVTRLLMRDSETQCSVAARLAYRYLADLRKRPQDLSRIEMTLSKLLEQCRQSRINMACPLIASLNAGDMSKN